LDRGPGANPVIRRPRPPSMAYAVALRTREFGIASPSGPTEAARKVRRPGRPAAARRRPGRRPRPLRGRRALPRRVSVRRERRGPRHARGRDGGPSRDHTARELAAGEARRARRSDGGTARRVADEGGAGATASSTRPRTSRAVGAAERYRTGARREWATASRHRAEAEGRQGPRGDRASDRRGLTGHCCTENVPTAPNDSRPRMHYESDTWCP
jgi:hypothetical protein